MKSKPAVSRINACFIALWISDVILTVLWAMMHGFEAEANPIMRWVLMNLGVTGFVGIKLAVLGVWLSVVDHLPRWFRVLFVCLLAPVVYLGIRMLFIPI